MTPAKVEVIRKLSDALWKERDLDAARDLVHPEAEFDWSDSRAPYQGHFKGHDELTQAFQAMMDAWDEWHPAFEEVIEVDDESVLIVTHVRARGKGSGVPVEARGASIWSVRGGKVIGAKLFQSKDEALAAVGLADALAAPRAGNDDCAITRPPDPGGEMPTYVMISTLTPEGVQTVKNNPQRIKEVNRELEQIGARVVHQWATLGRFDFVNIVEAPDEKTMAKVSLELGSRGTAHYESLPAIPIDEFIDSV